ncbi:MAG TPA: HdeD family acid-resistance protein [Bryobacteraceae bacterium]|jgi:uncharacterized membrane protein HdeD (DUF308 family)|nr:HdeD family acid-resistance protein [Bryobacteraceae bacterium]
MEELVIARNWWSLVIRGLVGVLVGIITFISPVITLQALVLLFGAYALIDGVMNIVGATHAARAHQRWGVLLLQGIAGILAAVVTVLWPGITALALVLVIGSWAIVTGVLQVIAAIRLRRYISGEWLLALAGILSVIFGVLVMIAPLVGALVIAMWVGVYAFIFGAVLIGLGLRLRAHTRGFGGAIPVPSR